MFVIRKIWELPQKFEGFTVSGSKNVGTASKKDDIALGYYS
ncbi:hypothetical protein LEP1GSC036_4364 [Leptospira weilii str. 2006001853]|uniref:Uncharacterized protein n=3 Tax=Leptospira weilii TaxID=28184 RepID=A0A828YY71_9LEPT|nr:hypothetical protein LEP1GSC036_4364 [Leptospira weilii str. 2006001853]EMJ66074.1 hypothetical protein LEP1GSC051_1064 [Leptospira sp. P2653]EMM72251.1 hypothetical protein LEP1GSC038_3910 [Leptospira weilii str. 2006001855]EMN46368.1 hypothetical protein LEP1GSC086_3149 [Leptospira weilii str. LNT 1234]EMY14304.1 hypothetical protein LEP1GSC043_1621 [Leptospira weilii str. Ecochallenge]